MFARIFAFIFTAFILLLATPTAYAQTPATPTAIPAYVSPVSPLYTDLLVHNLFHSFSCLAVGQSVIGQPCLTYQITQNAQGMIQSVPVLFQVNASGGTLGAETSLIGILYNNPPVRTADYIGSLGEQFGVVKQAHAQVGGSGEQVLNSVLPVLTLWQVSRNISYVLMIIIFVIIGIMIMFRHKINPQTVITAQAALPGLVIGLIMITFSYFLAGLVSDMAFVGTNVVGYYFSAVRDNPGDQNLVNDISQKNILSLFTPFTKIVGSGDVANALGSIWNDLASPNTNRLLPWDMDPQKALSTLSAFIITQLVLPFGGMFGGPGQVVSGVIAFGGTSLFPVQVVSLALSFVAMVILIYAMFRLLLRLINNYITIIFLTISAPFQFLAAALPGRQGIATNWILNMLANVLAFPAVLAVLYFIAFILGQDKLNSVCPTDTCVFKLSYQNQTQDSSFATKVYAAGETDTINNQTFPLFGAMELSIIRFLLAFGALIALPAIPDIVNRAVGKMGQAGQLIGQEIGGSYGAGQRYAGQFQQGPQGFAQQVGRIPGERGLILRKGGNGTVFWDRPTLGNMSEMLAGGTKAGQMTRFKVGASNMPIIGSFLPKSWKKG